MNYLSKLIRYLITFPHDIVAIPLLLLIHLLWGSDLRLEGLCLCTNLKPTSWPMNKNHWAPMAGWYSRWGGTTLGHAIMYGRDPSIQTQLHEHVHEHQLEASMLKSLALGLLAWSVTGKLWLSCGIWSLGFVTYLCANWLMAIVRGNRIYDECVHEEHAYAVGDSSKCTKKAEKYYLDRYDRML